MKFKVKRNDPRAVMPAKATPGSAGYDITAISKTGNVYDTGLSFEIPPGYVMLVFSRSGHGFKHNTRLANCVGVFDSDFRGELKVKLTRDDGEKEMPWVGDRVAQVVFIRLPKDELIEVTELDETERGDGGFGSSGR